jgi:hypothetical protein
MIVRLIALLVVKIASIEARAQAGAIPPILIGAREVRLGMKAADVLPEIKRKYEVSPLGVEPPETQSYLVATRGVPENVIANLVFSKGSLTHIRRYWGTSASRDGGMIARDLLTILESLGIGERTGRFAVVFTRSHGAPGYRAHDITIDLSMPYCEDGTPISLKQGTRSIEISITEPSDRLAGGVSIDELEQVP